MHRNPKIQSWCRIHNHHLIVDGKVIFKHDSTSFGEFSKQLYKQLEVNYPKFFKMDNLSKLAFLAAEALLKNEVDPNAENNIAVILANKSSSLDTDVKYQESISDKQNYFRSPAVFVYTLPNICVGEISIRHQLKSENSFFIFDAFNTSFMTDYANILMLTKKADKVLCGWTEFFGEDYNAFLYLVSDKGEIANDKQNIEILYNK